MNDLNIVVMGKTGVGKSTLINSIFCEDVAEVGSGQAVTKEVHVYSKNITITNSKAKKSDKSATTKRQINLYDTVGLEIDNKITEATLEDIKNILDKTSFKNVENNITTVWFCVNYGSSRFEDFEVDLIRELSIEYEIPFVIVITKCTGSGECELEQQINSQLPEVTAVRILAKDYKFRGGKLLPAFGVSQLLEQTVFCYENNRVKLLESKLELLERETAQRYELLENAKSLGNQCIANYGKKSQNIGWIPGFCIPAVHANCIKMLCELDDIFGIHTAESFSTEIFSNVIVGIIVTPFMAVPILSVAMASAYVETVGESYIKALESVFMNSSDADLADKELMAHRIREELEKNK